MKAQFNKETEKAINLTFKVELYGEEVTIKNVWFPKSQINVESIENGIVEFMPKNNWILNAKVKDYCKWVCENFQHVKSEVKTYMSPISNVVVDFCFV